MAKPVARRPTNRIAYSVQWGDDTDEDLKNLAVFTGPEAEVQSIAFARTVNGTRWAARENE